MPATNLEESPEINHDQMICYCEHTASQHLNVTVPTALNVFRWCTARYCTCNNFTLHRVEEKGKRSV